MFINTIARSLFAIGFAALLLVAPASARDAPDAPAIWKIDGPKGDIYLFGSVHLLPQGINWRTPALDAVLNEAKVVVFEIDVEESKNLAMMQQLIAKLGLLPPGQTLRKLLSPEGRVKLERVMTLLGIPAAGLDPLRPWLASITINVQWIVSQGYDPNSGVDDKVWGLAKQSGKQLAHLETIEEQLDVFAGLTRTNWDRLEAAIRAT
ncbi:MAG: TraB/GumN family protein, partial [Micropepsaceae bacterium]